MCELVSALHATEFALKLGMKLVHSLQYKANAVHEKILPLSKYNAFQPWEKYLLGELNIFLFVIYPCTNIDISGHSFYAIFEEKHFSLSIHKSFGLYNKCFHMIRI